jgi:hypothetical protein
MSLETWQGTVLTVPGADERVRRIEAELRLAAAGRDRETLRRVAAAPADSPLSAD